MSQRDERRHRRDDDTTEPSRFFDGGDARGARKTRNE